MMQNSINDNDNQPTEKAGDPNSIGRTPGAAEGERNPNEQNENENGGGNTPGSAEGERETGDDTSGDTESADEGK